VLLKIISTIHYLHSALMLSKPDDDDGAAPVPVCNLHQ
jgi:hypothetical protein